MIRSGLFLLFLLLAACSTDQIATDFTRTIARTVVLPVVSSVTPPPADGLATDCIMANATNAELNDLARDVGTRAGTSTDLIIRTVANRPETRACIAGKGLAPLML